MGTGKKELSSWDRLAMAMEEDEEMRAARPTHVERRRAELELDPGEVLPGSPDRLDPHLRRRVKEDAL